MKKKILMCIGKLVFWSVTALVIISVATIFAFLLFGALAAIKGFLTYLIY